MLRCLAIAVLLFSVSAGVMARSGDGVEVLVAERLELMRAVAVDKWRRNLPVEDLAREDRVLAAAVMAGLDLGLTRASSLRLFQAQIDAAKEIQGYWFERWRRGETPPRPVLDLDTEIRPRLIALGRRISEAAAGEPPDWRVFRRAVAVEGLSEDAVHRIHGALLAREFYPDRLTQVLDSGILRVATTGDYEPFTFRGEGGQVFRGIDIDMAGDLAGALGVEAVFVETRWSSLMADLRAGRFDIAMGGVSRTLDRQREGFFSRPYHVGGKTAIARCVDRERYASLEDIDRPGVRVVVNPGGTNERFVDGTITRARKVLHPDNRTIFVELLEGRADVMITDRIEVAWQASRNPELCAAVAGNFTYQQKAYLMPRDVALKEFVDTWLDLRIAEGRLDPLLSPP